MKRTHHPDSALIDALGGPTALARKLGLLKAGSVQRVANWRSRGIPLAIKVAHADIFMPAWLTR